MSIFRKKEEYNDIDEYDNNQEKKKGNKNIVKNTAPEGGVICVYGLVCSVNHVDEFNASVHIIGLS